MTDSRTGKVDLGYLCPNSLGESVSTRVSETLAQNINKKYNQGIHSTSISALRCAGTHIHFYLDLGIVYILNIHNTEY